MLLVFKPKVSQSLFWGYLLPGFVMGLVGYYCISFLGTEGLVFGTMVLVGALLLLLFFVLPFFIRYEVGPDQLTCSWLFGSYHIPLSSIVDVRPLQLKLRDITWTGPYLINTPSSVGPTYFDTLIAGHRTGVLIISSQQVGQWKALFVSPKDIDGFVASLRQASE